MKNKVKYTPPLLKLLELKKQGLPHNQAVKKAAAHHRKQAAAKNK